VAHNVIRTRRSPVGESDLGIGPAAASVGSGGGFLTVRTVSQGASVIGGLVGFSGEAAGCLGHVGSQRLDDELGVSVHAAQGVGGESSLCDAGHTLAGRWMSKSGRSERRRRKRFHEPNHDDGRDKPQMLLENKVAVIYGAGGSIGGAIAQAFAREGALTHLAGRSKATVEVLASQIRSDGGRAHAAELDVLDEQLVDAYVDQVAEQAGRIDVSVNVIGLGDVQQPLTEISLQDFLQPITTAMRAHFLTTRAAARHMKKQGSGVVLAFGGSGATTMPGLGGFVVALDALEGLRRQWATELGPYGIRVVTLKSAGVPEVIPADFPNREKIIEGLPPTLVGRHATLADVGDVAAFAASDKARTLTATAVNISCGAMMD
jgi:NAD(P)-dependent dehydrogenase (short-subunit alcohol dehydrogenase family)